MPLLHTHKSRYMLWTPRKRGGRHAEHNNWQPSKRLRSHNDISQVLPNKYCYSFTQSSNIVFYSPEGISEIPLQQCFIHITGIQYVIHCCIFTRKYMLGTLPIYCGIPTFQTFQPYHLTPQLTCVQKTT